MQAAARQVRVCRGPRVRPGPCEHLGPQLAVDLVQVRPPPLRLHLAGQGVRPVRARPAGAAHGRWLRSPRVSAGEEAHVRARFRTLNDVM